MWRWSRKRCIRNPVFDFMSMLGEAEEEFGVEIDPQEASDIRTVQEAVDYLAGLKAKQEL